MRKKTKIMTMIAVAAVSVWIAGCSADSKPQEDTTAQETTTVQASETAGTKADDSTKEGQESQADGSDAADEKYIVTVATFKSEETLENNERQALFTDEKGNEFIANISEDTKVEGDLVEGETYEVTHTEMMTRSMPGIYPQVSEIKPAE